MELEVVINKCYGGFGLSLNAVVKYLELCDQDYYIYHDNHKIADLSGHIGNDADMYIVCTENHGEYISNSKVLSVDVFNYHTIKRTDKNLIHVVRELGEMANVNGSNLKIESIEIDLDTMITDLDGYENINL